MAVWLSQMKRNHISLYQTLRSLRRVPWLGTLKQNKAEKHRIVLMVYFAYGRHTMSSGKWSQCHLIFPKITSLEKRPFLLLPNKASAQGSSSFVRKCSSEAPPLPTRSQDTAECWDRSWGCCTFPSTSSLPTAVESHFHWYLTLPILKLRRVMCP